MAKTVKIKFKVEKKELIYYSALLAAAAGLIFSTYQIYDQIQSYEELKERHEDLIGKFKNLNESSNALLQRHASLTEEVLAVRSDNTIMEQQIKKCNRFLKGADSECKISRDEDLGSCVDECNTQLEKRSRQCNQDINTHIDECNALLRKQLKDCNEHWQEQIRLIN